MKSRHSGIKLAVIAISMLAPVLVRAADSIESTGAPGFEIKIPLGIPQELWAYFIPKDNAMTAAKVELGRKLFFEQRLSADGSVSCASENDVVYDAIC